VVFQPGRFHQLFKQAFLEEKDLTFFVMLRFFRAPARGHVQPFSHSVLPCRFRVHSGIL